MPPILRHLDRHILLILAVSIFAWAPLLTPAYFFRAHDAPHSIFYLVEFDQTLRDGYLWPRWATDFAFGYGYPLFNIYAPLALYAAEILHLSGLSLIAAVKTMYALVTLGAGLTMYLFVRRLYGRDAALLAGIVYMYVPFHLLEIFVRSAYSEFVALALLPLVLYSFTELVAAPSPRRFALAGLAYGLLALTHIASLFTFTPFLAFYILYLLAKTWRTQGMGYVLRAALYALGSGLLGLALSAIYLVPVLAELRFVKVEQWTAYNYGYDQHFVHFSQLLSPMWDYGYSGPGLEDGMSFQLGAAILVLLAFAGWRVLSPRAALPRRGIALFFLIATVLLVWLMSPAAQFAWRILPIASLVQFPWRLLSLTAVTMSVVAGSLLAHTVRESGNQEIRKSGNQGHGSSVTPSTESPILDPLMPDSLTPDSLILLLVVVLGSFSYTLPQYTAVEPWREQPEAIARWDRFSVADRVAMMAYTEQQPTTSPMESQYLAGEPLQVAAILTGTGRVETLRRGGASDEVRVYAEGPVTLQFFTYDYPGWQVRVDGQRTPHRHAPPYGLITVDVPAGEHHISLRMASTPARTIGSAISLAAILVIGAGLFREHIWRRGSRLL
jgi:hypothetical protein